MAYNFAYTGYPPPSNPRMMNPPPNILGPPMFHNNNSPWRPPPERPQFNINSFMTPPHVVQRPSFPPQNMFTGSPMHQVHRQHFTPDNTFSHEASKGPQENFPFNNNNGPGFQNNGHFQGHHGRGRGFMRGQSRGQGFRGGFRGGVHNGNQNGFNKTKKPKVDKRDLAENNVYFCDICDRGFKTEDKHREHVDGHIQCSFKDCPFIAAPKLVNLHARMQHSSGLATQVWQVKSADDINKWREERKRNYPTTDNVARKKQEREDKIARGEVLQTKEFGKMRNGRGGNNRRGGRGKWRGRGRGRWRDYDNGGENGDYPQAVDGSDSDGPPEETVIMKSTTGDEVLVQPGVVSDATGTKAEVNAGTSTELRAQVLSPQEPNTSLTLLTSYGESSPDSQVSGDDGERSPIESDTKSATQSTASPSKLVSPQKPTVTVGVSPPSAESQNQATLQDVASSLEPSQSAVNGASICSVHNSRSPHKSASQDASPGISSADPTAASPDSVLGQHQKHNQSRGQNVRDHRGQQGNKRTAGSEQNNVPPQKKKKEQTRQPVHKYTLLEKLLAPDMRRERNKVLQCVHYIVKNKFFG